MRSDIPRTRFVLAPDGVRIAYQRDWGRGVGLAGGAPGLVADDDLRRACGRYERFAVDRAYMADGWAQMAAIDMRLRLEAGRS